MAKRPVFIVLDKKPFYEVVYVDFVFNPGFSLVQKQKNVNALHLAYSQVYNDFPLEISTKSLQEEGIALSAFNLTKRIPSLGISASVECVYQGSKVFEKGGPYKDLYVTSSKEAKKDIRLTSSGKMIFYSFDDVEFQPFPTSCFYDWLYIRALMENPALSQKLLSYHAFTDIEFNPARSLNCQARAAAIFVSLSRSKMLSVTENYNIFRSLFMEEGL